VRAVTGIREFDEVYGAVFEKGSLVVVAGHPGAGKTTFAVTVSYNAMREGYRVLYVMFQEDKEKLYRNMLNLGINLRAFESKGLFKYARIPVTLDPKTSCEWLLNTTSEYKPDVIVVDSVNALLGRSGEEESLREWLQNFFYVLPRLSSALAILIAELPYGTEELKLGAIEFVADAVFVLKHRVEKNMLVRLLEVRKTRGAASVIAEIPFSIINGVGLKIHMPPILAELPLEGEELSIPIKSLSRSISHIHRGFVIYGVYPPETKGALLRRLLIGLLLSLNLKTLYISYNYSPKQVAEFLASYISRYGIERDTARKIVEEHFEIVGVNPYAQSSLELYSMELELVERVKDRVDVVAFDDVGLISLTAKKQRELLYNKVNAIKKHGLIVTWIGSLIDIHAHRVWCSLSDLIIRLKPRVTGKSVALKTIIWRRNAIKPFILEEADLENVVQEISSILREKFANKPQQ